MPIIVQIPVNVELQVQQQFVDRYVQFIYLFKTLPINKITARRELCTTHLHKAL